MKRLAQCLLLIAVSIAFLPHPASGQATVLIDPLDPVYGDVQKLVAAGLVDRIIVGQRPFSRLVLADIVRQAARRLESAPLSDGGVSASPDAGLRLGPDESEFLRGLLAQMRSRFQLRQESSESARPRIQPLHEPLLGVGIDETAARSPMRLIPPQNGLGKIDGVLNPVLANRQGRPLISGSNFIASSQHVWESAHLAIEARPEVQLLSNSGKSDGRVVLQEAQARLLLGNVALDIGRQYLVWGQGSDVGLLGSNNSPPLDQIRLSNELPLVLPWFFGKLGPSKFSIFYSKLGADQNFPNPYFVGYKASFELASAFEFGGVVYTKSGGHGAPIGTLGGRIMDLFPFLDASNYANKIGVPGKFEFSDRYAGLDARVRFSALRGAEAYTELLLNDFDVRRLRSVLWEDAGHVFGLSFPRLTGDGKLGAWAEFHHTGNRYYEHAQFITGQTSHQMLIGDQLGPDADGGYANLEAYLTSRHRVWLQAALERRSNDQYAYWNVPLPAFGWSRTEIRPKEWRQRILLSWRETSEPGRVGVLAQAGYERARNFDFVQGQDRNNFLARLGLDYVFH